jgi:hypothetical protein
MCRQACEVDLHKMRGAKPLLHTHPSKVFLFSVEQWKRFNNLISNVAYYFANFVTSREYLQPRFF